MNVTKESTIIINLKEKDAWKLRIILEDFTACKVEKDGFYNLARWLIEELDLVVEE